MTREKSNWDDIPSLDGLTVDWEYEPENTLGKRASLRISTQDLQPLLGGKNIPVKVVSKTYDEKGYLVDLSLGGGAILLPEGLAENQLLKIGFFLGRQKIVVRGVVKNISLTENGYRTGVEFIDLSEEARAYISSLISSKGYKEI